MTVPLWIAWPFLIAGLFCIFGLMLFGSAWLWWAGIDLWVKWRRMKPDLVVAYVDVIQKRKNTQNDQSPS